MLTRLPAPHRLGPADAWALIHANFVTSASVVALTAPAYVRLLDRIARTDIAGGRCYDEVIAASAQAKVDVLLTFNPRHFDPAPAGMQVIEPR